MAAKERPVTRPVSGLDIASGPLLERIGVQPVTLLQVMDVDFRRHVEHVHAVMESTVVAQGGVFDVGIEELVRAFITCIHSRVQHTRLKNAFPKQSQFIHPRAMECTPTQFAYVANAVGVVLFPEGLKIVPELSDEALQLVMTHEEWQALAVRLRGYEPLGVRLVHALDARDEGDDKVMTIIPVVSLSGEIVYTSNEPAAGTQFLTASTLGMAAVDIPLDIPSRSWIPKYTVGSIRLVTFYPQFARVSEAG